MDIRCKKCDSSFSIEKDRVQDGRVICPYCGAKYRNRASRSGASQPANNTGFYWVVLPIVIAVALSVGFLGRGLFEDDKDKDAAPEIAQTETDSATTTTEDSKKSDSEAKTKTDTAAATTSTTTSENATVAKSDGEAKSTTSVTPSTSTTTPSTPSTTAVAKSEPTQPQFRQWKAEDGTVIATGNLVSITGDQEITITDGKETTRVPQGLLGSNDKQFLKTQPHLLAKAQQPADLPDQAEAVASTSVSDLPDDLPGGPPTTPAPSGAVRDWKAIDGTVLGRGRLVKVIGDQEIVINDGKEESRFPIGILGEEEKSIINSNAQSIAKVDTPQDLPDTQGPATTSPPPGLDVSNPDSTRVWTDSNGEPIIHGTFAGMSRSGKIRIAPAVRTWETEEHGTFEGVFFILHSNIGDPNIYTRIGDVVAPWATDEFADIPRQELSDQDQQYLGQVEKIHGFAIINKGKRVEYFSIPIDRFSKEDADFALQLHQLSESAE